MSSTTLKRWDESGIPLLIARLVIGGMFVWLGVHKVTDPVEFLKLIRQYHMVPESVPLLLNAMAALLPWIEICCGVLLIAGIAVRGSALMLLVMLTVFTVAIFMRALGIHSAEHIAFCAIKFDCGCGGGEVYVCRKLPENLGLWLLAWVALLSNAYRFCLWRNLIPTHSPWRMEGY